MAVQLNQFLERFERMEKLAQATLPKNPGGLDGIDSMPGSEHDSKAPDEAKQPNKEVQQGQPAGATTGDGAVNGGDAKPLNDGKLELDQPLLNAEKKPLVTDDALTAKEASARLESIVASLLSDIKQPVKTASDNTAKTDDEKAKELAAKEAEAKAAKEAAEKAAAEQAAKEAAEKVKQEQEEQQKIASGKQTIKLDDETIQKLAAAQAAFMAGREAAEKTLAKTQKVASAKEQAIADIRAAIIKSAQDQGLNPEEAAAAADGAMATAGIDAAGAAGAGDEGAAAGDAGAVDLPENVTPQEVVDAVVQLVASGDLDQNTGAAVIDEIAGDINFTPDEAAGLLANGLESGQITPEEAESIAAAIEGGEGAGAGADAGAAAGAAADDEAKGAADAAAAAADAADEAKGAAAAEEALKTAAALVRQDAFAKVASVIKATRTQAAQAAQAAQVKQAEEAKGAKPGATILSKVASILQQRKEALDAQAKEEAEKQAAAQAPSEKYMAGFRKKAAEMGVDPEKLMTYLKANQPKEQAK